MFCSTYQYGNCFRVDITDVTEEILNTLVNMIIVHEKEVINDEIIIKLDIYYCCIGNIGDESAT